MTFQSPFTDQFKAIWAEKRVVSICLFIALAQFQYGYDSAAVAGFQSMPGFLAVYGYVDPQNPIGYNISTKVQTLIQSLIQLGSLASCIVIFKFGSFFNGRRGLWVGSVLSFVSVGIQIGSTNVAALYVGRILLGFSNGFLTTYSAIYMGESAPARIRGPVIGMVMLQISLGALIGILVDNYTQVHLTRISYQIPLAVMFAVPVLISAGLLLLPESPRYYVAKGQYDKAAQAIRKLRGLTDEDKIERDVEIMRRAWVAETEMHTSVHLLDAFCGPDLRRTILSVAAAVSQTASGITFISAFSVYFFAQANIGAPFKWVVISLAVGLTANMLSFPAMRFIPRRHLLLGTSLLNCATMCGMAIAYTVSSPDSATAGKVVVALCIVFVWVYGFGQGPVLWALQTEVPSQRLRSQTVGFAQGANFVFGWLSSYCSPYFINPESLNWGPKYCYIWGGSNLIVAVFVFFFVPETKGRSLEELDELFEKRVPARKFASHVTAISQPDAGHLVVSKDDAEAAHAEHEEHEEHPRKAG